MDAFESDLVPVLGLCRSGLARLRKQHLERGVDFRITKKRVAWTQDGFKKICGVLRLDPEKLAGGATAARDGAEFGDGNMPSVPAVRVPEVLAVWNCKLVNKRLILAYRPGTDPELRENIVRVRVRSSENFMKFVNGKPMELKAHHVQADLYELATACPRFKGRW